MFGLTYAFSRNFVLQFQFIKKYFHFLKKLHIFLLISTAKFCYMIVFFGNFPETSDILRSLENCKNPKKLHRVACGNE